MKFCNLKNLVDSIIFVIVMDKRGIEITDTIPDSELIARVLAGDKEQYAVIIKRYNARLYRIAMAIVNNDAEAEDIMQVAYIKAYEHLNQFASKSAFSTWLTRILVNESLLRTKQKYRTIAIGEKSSDQEADRLGISIAKTPSDKMVNTELKEILETSIRRLPEKYRVVFIMREIEGLNIAETQECLDLSEANVKVRLNRAKILLRDMLSSFYKKEDILYFHLTRCDRMVESVMRQLP